jgi:ubiquinone/menaquinone biosynthesis C-methylase UbiE
MAATQQLYPAPFDAVAERYDESFTFSRIGQIQRNAVWRELSRAFRSGDRILEIGCGTGVDACFLGERGVRVVACDSSSQMIAVAEQRIQEKRLQKVVQPIRLAAEDIAALQTSERFDGAFSNFGALNCVKDLRKLSIDLGRMLKPGAHALLCWMGPCCLWEMIWYLSQRKANKAFRRFRREGVSASVGGGEFWVGYPKLRELERAFHSEFRLRMVRGIGVAVPPSYMESWAHSHARMLQLCAKADVVMGRVPAIRVLGDHVLLEFERKNTKLRSA